MDLHTAEGIDYFRTAKERGHFTALSSYLCLDSQANLLISALSTDEISLHDAPRYLDQAQRDIAGLGETVNTQKTLIHHRHLTLDMAALADAVRMNRISAGELIECLDVSLSDIKAIGQHFAKILPPAYWNVRRRTDSTIACKVFAMPELTEMILSHCSHADVMSAYQLCKEIRNIIDASPKLQIQVCLKPFASPFPETFPFTGHDTPGFRCFRTAPRIKARISLRVDKSGVYWPHIGERYLNMFICQPPIYSALVTEDCQLGDNEMFGPIEPVQLASERGLTARDLYDMAKEFAGNHRECWECADPIQFRLSADGKARFAVEFKECLDDQEWDAAAEETTRHERYVAKRLAREVQGLRSGQDDSEMVVSDEQSDVEDTDDDSEGQSEYSDSLEDRDDMRASEHEMGEEELADAVYEGYGNGDEVE